MSRVTVKIIDGMPAVVRETTTETGQIQSRILDVETLRQLIDTNAISLDSQQQRLCEFIFINDWSIRTILRFSAFKFDFFLFL